MRHRQERKKRKKPREEERGQEEEVIITGIEKQRQEVEGKARENRTKKER